MSNYIRESIDLITKIVNTEDFLLLKVTDNNAYEYNMKKMFPEFSEQYPLLFKKAINKEDLSMLDTMLQSMDEIQNKKELDTDKIKEIHTSLGEKIAEKYLYPTIGKPPTK